MVLLSQHEKIVVFFVVGLCSRCFASFLFVVTLWGFRDSFGAGQAWFTKGGRPRGSGFGFGLVGVGWLAGVRYYGGGGLLQEVVRLVGR